MNSIRKWLYKPKKTDQSLLAQFFYADEDLNAVAAELDSFDGRKDPDRCTALVNHLRQCQDKVLNICQMIMDEVIPEERAPRDFRAKFPDDVLQENLAGQLWFGAECLAAGSSILNRELESATMRPLAKALTKSLENVRNLLREQCFHSPPEFTEKICECLKILDRLFAEFELCYVSAMVPVKSVHEYEAQQSITVLFSETLQRALRLDLLSQDQVDSCDPALMFTIPRLAIVAGLLIFPEGPLCLDRGELSDMFRPFRSLLLKIRELLWTLTRTELTTLERSLCSVDEPTIEGVEEGGGPRTGQHIVTRKKSKRTEYPIATQSIQDYLDQFYKDFPHCKEFISDMCTPVTVAPTQSQRSHETGEARVSSRPKPGTVSTVNPSLNFHLITTALNAANAAALAHNQQTNNHHHHSHFRSNVGTNPSPKKEKKGEGSCTKESESEVKKEAPSIVQVKVEGESNFSILAESKPDPTTASHSSSSDSGLSSMAEPPAIPPQTGANPPPTPPTVLSSPSSTSSSSLLCNVELEKFSSGPPPPKVLEERVEEEEEEAEEVVEAVEIVEDVKGSHTYLQVEEIKSKNSSQDLSCCSGSECSASIGGESNCETSSFDSSECQDDIEIALAMQAAEIASRNEVRSRFKNTSDLIHRLFICISGVADQLQTNYAADLRSTLKCVFAMNATPVPSITESSSSLSVEDNSTDVTPEPSLDEEAADLAALDGDYAREHFAESSEQDAPPPTWVPDQLAPQCMSCSASFTVVRRRHHCRNCGKVFCGKCSGNSIPLPKYKIYKPARVCNVCFLTLGPIYSTPFPLPASPLTS